MKIIDKKGISFLEITCPSTNAYTCIVSGLINYTKGLTVHVLINTTATGASAININDLGMVPIVYSLGNPITSGGLRAGFPYQLCYNGTNFIVLDKGADWNLTSAHLIKNRTATFSNATASLNFYNN